VRAFSCSGLVEEPLDGNENLLGIASGTAVEFEFLGGTGAFDLQ
jgi:hypothetical protein